MFIGLCRYEEWGKVCLAHSNLLLRQLTVIINRVAPAALCLVICLATFAFLVCCTPDDLLLGISD